MAALAIGSIVLVEAIRSVSGIESTQTNLSLTLVGLATTLELVVLAWSSARRGITEAVIAAVVGSFAYNATMSLGAAASPARSQSRIRVCFAVPLSSCLRRWWR